MRQHKWQPVSSPRLLSSSGHRTLERMSSFCPESGSVRQPKVGATRLPWVRRATPFNPKRGCAARTHDRTQPRWGWRSRWRGNPRLTVQPWATATAPFGAGKRRRRIRASFLHESSVFPWDRWRRSCAAQAHRVLSRSAFARHRAGRRTGSLRSARSSSLCEGAFTLAASSRVAKIAL